MHPKLPDCIVTHTPPSKFDLARKGMGSEQIKVGIEIKVGNRQVWNAFGFQKRNRNSVIWELDDVASMSQNAEKVLEKHLHYSWSASLEDSEKKETEIASSGNWTIFAPSRGTAAVERVCPPAGVALRAGPLSLFFCLSCSLSRSALRISDLCISALTCSHPGRLPLARNREMTPAGLEPAVPGSIGRCLIHWATGPSVN